MTVDELRNWWDLASLRERDAKVAEIILMVQITTRLTITLPFG